jgi:hypothetical protein
MFVPAVTASRLKSHVPDGTGRTERRQHVEPYRPLKMIAVKFVSNRENHTIAEIVCAHDLLLHLPLLAVYDERASPHCLLL